MAGKNGVNKFISDSYGYGGYRESEMARDQWKDLTYDAQHGTGASKNRKSYYDNWDQDFEQTYVRAKLLFSIISIYFDYLSEKSVGFTQGFKMQAVS